jgi:hypothetical protein
MAESFVGKRVVYGARIALQEANDQLAAAQQYDVAALRSLETVHDSGSDWDNRVRETVRLLKLRDAAVARAGKLLATAEQYQRFSDL